MTKRVLAFLMVMAMVLSLVPTVVLAEEAAVPGYTMIMQKAHNQTEGSLAIDIYLQANTAEQPDVTGYQFTVTPAEGIAVTGASDATGNDNLAGNDTTFIYSPTAEKPIAVGTGKVLVATITVAGETLPATVAAAATIAEAKVTQAEAEFIPTFKTIESACTDHACGHESDKWIAGTNENIKGTIAAGKYYLTEDISVDAALNVAANANVTICLNGFNIAPSKVDVKLFTLKGKNAVLNICDCTATGEGKSYTAGKLINNANWGGVFRVENGNNITVNVFGGIIDNSQNTKANKDQSGSTIYVMGTNTFNMLGGKCYGLNGPTGTAAGPIIIRGSKVGDATGYFANMTFEACGHDIVSAHSGGSGDAASVNDSSIIILENVTTVDSLEDANAVSTTGNRIKSLTIKGNCVFDAPVYVTSAEDVILDLGPKAKVAVKTGIERTPETLGEDVIIPEGATVTPGTLTYENAGAYVTYVDGKFDWSVHTHDEIAFKVWNDPTSLPTEGNYYLDTDVTITAQAEVSSGKTLTLDLNGHTITQTTAKARIYSVYGTLNLYDCQEGYDAEGNWTGGNITGGSNGSGAAVCVQQAKSSGATAARATFNMYGGRISGNNSTSSGGAVYVSYSQVKSGKNYAGGIFNMYGGEICNNTAGSWGGAITAMGMTTSPKEGEAQGVAASEGMGAQVNIYGGAIYGNAVTSKTGGYGGAINTNHDSVLNIEGGNFYDNSAFRGGAIYISGSTVANIENTIFNGNAADDKQDKSTTNGGSGGAIYITGATASLTVTDCDFTNNTAHRTNEGSDYAGLGGAIHVVTSHAVIDGCTFENNSTNRHGGALAMRDDGSSMVIRNSVITGNEAGGVGGAMYYLNGGPLTVENVTITGNTAKSNGALYVTSANAKLYLGGKVVIAGNLTSGTTKETNRNLYFQKQTSRTDYMIYVNELAAGSHIEAMNEVVMDANVVIQTGAADATVTATQTDWDCGWVTVYNTTSDLGRTISRVDGQFVYGHVHMIDGQPVTFQPLDSGTIPSDGGYYYLTKDVTGSNKIASNVNLCFNGKVLTVGSTGRGLFVDLAQTGYTINIYDCTASYAADGTYISGGITGGDNENFGGAVRLNASNGSSHVLNWYGGAIFNNVRTISSSGSGGGVAMYLQAKGSYDDPATTETTKVAFAYAPVLNWYDGAVYGNVIQDINAKTTSTVAGIIQAGSGVVLNIHDGAFYNNEVKDTDTITNTVSGVFYSGTKNIYGGRFFGNKAYAGGVAHTGAINVYGGEFYENEANNGAVFYSSSAITIEGGSFHDNVAGTEGSAEEAGRQGNGGVIYATGNTTITGGSFENNTCYGYGGVILQGNSGNVLTITGTADAPIVFRGNQAIRHFKSTTTDDVTTIALDNNSGNGGAIKLNNGTINATHVLFEDNGAYEGGAYCISDGTGSKWISNFTNVTFKNNSAEALGGALAAENGTLTVTDCVFEGNEATTASAAFGGAIYLFSTGSHKSGDNTINHTIDATFTRCTFNENSSAYYGGVINASGNNASQKVTLTVDDCDFTNNRATSRCGVIRFVKNTDLTATNCDFVGNYAGEGAICRTENAASNCEFVDCNFLDNQSNSSGGALCLNYIGIANITRCNFQGNTTKSYGGAVRLDGSSNTSEWNFTDCIFTGNTAGTNGGAFYIEPDKAGAGMNGAVTLTNCQITDNTAKAASAMYISTGDFAADVTLVNTTITGNASQTHAAIYSAGVSDSKIALVGATVIAGNTCEAAATYGTEVCLGAKNVDGVPNNVCLDISGLTEGANVGMATTATRFAQYPVFTINGGAAQAAYLFSSNIDYMDIAAKDGELYMVRFIDEDGTAYETLQAYIDTQAAAGAEVITLPVSATEEIAIAEDMTINLNGNTTTKFIVAENKTLALVDSATNDYTSENAAKVAVEGAYAFYAEDDTNGLKRYVVLENEDGTVSAHRVYLAITTKVLRPTNNGVGFKAIFAGSDVITENQDMFGIEISTTADFAKTSTGFFTEMTAGIAGTSTPNQKTIILRDVLKEGMDNATSYNTTIYGRPYIVIGEEVVYGTTVSTTMSDLVDAALKSNDATVVEAVNAMLAQFGMSAK